MDRLETLRKKQYTSLKHAVCLPNSCDVKSLNIFLKNNKRLNPYDIKFLYCQDINNIPLTTGALIYM